MSEHAPDRVWSGIDVPKTIAGVLAAVSAAVLGSFLGVAGTLAGAALASIVGSVGTEIYRKFIDRSHKKIVSTFVTAPAAVGTPAVAAASDETPSQPEPDSAPAAAGATKMRWGRVAMVAASVFVLAIGALTVFELITGRSAADATGHHGGSSTTVGSIFGGQKKSAQVTTPASTPVSTAPTDAPATGSTGTAATTPPADVSTTGSTPSAAPTGTTTPEPGTTDTQNLDGNGQNGSGQNGSVQNDQAPPATQQP